MLIFTQPFQKCSFYFQDRGCRAAFSHCFSFPRRQAALLLLAWALFPASVTCHKARKGKGLLGSGRSPGLSRTAVGIASPEAARCRALPEGDRRDAPGPGATYRRLSRAPLLWAHTSESYREKSGFLAFPSHPLLPRKNFSLLLWLFFPTVISSSRNHPRIFLVLDGEDETPCL